MLKSIIFLAGLLPALADGDDQPCLTSLGRFPCAPRGSGAFRCLSATQVCDGVADCDNNEDEGAFCQTACRSPCPSGRQCLPTPTGDACHCGPGYNVTSAGVCADVDECANGSLGGCSQICTNTAGSFACSCADGFSFRSDVSRPKGMCYAPTGDLTLFYATKASIHVMRVSDRTSRPKTSNVKVYRSSVQGAIAIAYDARENRALWTATNDGAEGIMWVDVRLQDAEPDYFLRGDDFHLPEGIAVDYVARNVYFTDSHADSDGGSYVGVASLSNRRWKKLITDNRWLHKPRGVALYQPRRYLFYTDWGANAALVRADMDGRNVRAIVTTGVTWINDLAVDRVQRRIFLVDANHDRIESVDLDGGNRKVILDGLVRHPFSLEVFEDWLYWSDWHSDQVHYSGKNGESQGFLFEDADEKPMGIHLHHPLMEPNMDNPCLDADCSHMCLLAAEGYACSCPDDLSDDEACEEKSVVVKGDKWWKDENVNDGGSDGALIALFALALLLGSLLVLAAVCNWLGAGRIGACDNPSTKTDPHWSAIGDDAPMSFEPVHFDGVDVACSQPVEDDNAGGHASSVENEVSYGVDNSGESLLT